jgi:hypothetical protein
VQAAIDNHAGDKSYGTTQAEESNTQAEEINTGHGVSSSVSTLPPA